MKLSIKRWLVFVLCVLGGSLSAHPGHQTVAEMAFNEKTSCLEISLVVHAEDLEQALSRAEKRPVKLDQAPAAELDRWLQAYLTTTFQVRDAGGALQPLRWVGREPAAPSLAEPKASPDDWILHFEVPLPGGMDQTSLWNGIFCELFEDQINLVDLHVAGKKHTLGFSPQHGEKNRLLEPQN